MISQLVFLVYISEKNNNSFYSNKKYVGDTLYISSNKVLFDFNTWFNFKHNYIKNIFKLMFLPNNHTLFGVKFTYLQLIKAT